MTRRLLIVAITAVLAAGLCISSAAAEQGKKVALETSKGKIVIALAAEKAPISTKNFLEYVKGGYYNGTIFHRVIPSFMVQGGGFTEAMQQKPGARDAIKNEADNGLLNKRGTVAMARTQAKDSATCQFFVNLVDNKFLDHGAGGFGYAVFGNVVEGMEVVDAIAKVETANSGRYQNVPKEPVVIKSASVVE